MTKPAEILVLGGTHGNEPFGIELVNSLQENRIPNVDAVIANQEAAAAGKRFIDTNLNFGTSPEDNSYEYDILRDEEIRRHGKIVGHDDLHPGNLTFNETQELHGIFDYGLTRVTTLAEELRHLARIGEVATQAAAAHVTQATGIELRVESIERFMLMQAVGSIAFCVSFGENIQQPILRDRIALVRKALPEYDWSELPR